MRRWFSILALLTVCATAKAQYNAGSAYTFSRWWAAKASGGDIPVADGLYGYWTFDSDFTDSVGTNDLAAYSSGAEDPVIASGLIGNAVFFNGQSNRVLQVTNFPANFSSSGSATFCAWVRSFEYTAVLGDLGKSTSSSLYPYQNTKIYTDFFLNYRIGPATAVGSVTNWTLLTIRSDGTATNGYQIWMGTNRIYAGQSYGAISNNAIFMLGKNDTSGMYFDGFFDDVRLYDRAITDEEIETLVEWGESQ